MDRMSERERIVREHMESENRHEFDVTMATFEHPRDEIVAPPSPTSATSSSRCTTRTMR